MRRRAIPLVLALLPACSALGGRADDPGTVSRPTSNPLPPGTVLVQDVAFTPSEVAVAAGGEVTWTVSDGGLKHTITADDGSFDAGEISAGEFKHAFPTAGRFPYHCNVHSRMKGTVVVT
jgi:hypothetical protein